MANRKPSSLPKFKGQVESVFEKEFHGFTAQCRLSKRESDIVLALIRNVTNSEDIARILGISTHTVNNHLKSIFEKTGTKSKTEILSSFLSYTAEFFESKQLLVRKPRILVLDSDLASCERVAKGLAEWGFKTYSLLDAHRLPEYLGKYPIDCVVCSLELKDSSGLAVLKNLRRNYTNWPHFVLAAPSKQTAEPWSLEEALHAGASGVLLQPLDIDILGKTILSHLADVNDRDRFLPESSTPPIVIDDSSADEETQIGFGGAFVPMENNPETLAQLGIGSIVDLTVVPATGRQETLRVKGQVVWKRSTETRGLRSGVGIRFVTMSDKDQIVFDRYLRENDVTSYIPLGRVEDTARKLLGIPSKVPSTGS
jgi:DNA-binding NarL/FixJ family response regulator